MVVLNTSAMPDLIDVLGRLATEALTRGSADNITVIVAFLKPVDTLESVFRGGKQKHAAYMVLHGLHYCAPHQSEPASHVVTYSLGF